MPSGGTLPDVRKRAQWMFDADGQLTERGREDRVSHVRWLQDVRSQPRRQGWALGLTGLGLAAVGAWLGRDSGSMSILTAFGALLAFAGVKVAQRARQQFDAAVGRYDELTAAVLIWTTLPEAARKRAEAAHRGTKALRWAAKGAMFLAGFDVDSDN